MKKSIILLALMGLTIALFINPAFAQRYKTGLLFETEIRNQAMKSLSVLSARNFLRNRFIISDEI